MDEFDEDNDAYVASDFYTLVADAQFNELKEVEKHRAREREDARLLQEKSNASVMTLAQIVGLRTEREMEQLTQDRDEREVEKSEAEDKKRKADEKERLVARFPFPDL